MYFSTENTLVSFLALKWTVVNFFLWWQGLLKNGFHVSCWVPVNIVRVPRLQARAKDLSWMSNTIRCFTFCCLCKSPKQFCETMRLLTDIDAEDQVTKSHLPEATKLIEGMKSEFKSDFPASFFTLHCVVSADLLLGLRQGACRQISG